MPHLDLARTEILRRRSWLAAERFFRALARAAPELSRYNPDQPRVPAGQPGGGQWAGAGGSRSASNQGRVDLAAGFRPEHEDMTAGAFASVYCEGRVRRELPGQFENMRIGDIMKLAKQGDASARKCLKIIGRERFQK